MLRPGYPIVTERLVIRPFRPGDLDDLVAYYGRQDVHRYLYTVPHDRAETRKVLERKSGQVVLSEEGSALTLAVEWPEVGRVIGEVMLKWLSREHRRGEVGFLFHPDFHGRGFATEAARAMLHVGFDELGLHRIIGTCDARNLASARVLARLGMHREAHLVDHEWFKGEWSDELIYAVREDEFRARP